VPIFADTHGIMVNISTEQIQLATLSFVVLWWKVICTYFLVLCTHLPPCDCRQHAVGQSVHVAHYLHSLYMLLLQCL